MRYRLMVDGVPIAKVETKEMADAIMKHTMASLILEVELFQGTERRGVYQRGKYFGNSKSDQRGYRIGLIGSDSLDVQPARTRRQRNSI